MTLHRILSLAAALALMVPAAVIAKKPADAGSKGKGHSKAKTYVFKGTWNDGAGGVDVTGGNSRVRKGDFKGTTVVFDLTNAKIRVADTDGDGDQDADDVQQGDKVVVQAKLAKDAAQPFAARKLVDQTNPQPDEDDEAEAEPTPEPTAEPTVTPDAE